MDALELRCLARVRLLVLREIVAGGGEPRPAQVRRAFAPIAAWLAPPARARGARGAAVVRETVRGKKHRVGRVRGEKPLPWMEEET